MNDNQNKESLFVPTRACKSKKRIELRRSSPLTVSSEINEEKKELSLDEIEIDESDMEIMAIIAGNDKYLKTHFVYDGEEDILKTRQFFPLM